MKNKDAVDHVIDLLLSDPSGWEVQDVRLVNKQHYAHTSGVALLFVEAHPCAIVGTSTLFTCWEAARIKKALKRHDALKVGLTVAAALSEVRSASE